MLNVVTVPLRRTVYEGYCTKCGLWRTQTQKKVEDPKNVPCPNCGKKFERFDVLGTALVPVPWTRVGAGRYVNPFVRPTTAKGVEGDLAELSVVAS